MECGMGMAYMYCLYSTTNLKIWQDNSYFEGEWKEDFMHGKGKMVHADGDIYEGEWAFDMAHGFGLYAHSGVLIIFVFSLFLF